MTRPASGSTAAAPAVRAGAATRSRSACAHGLGDGTYTATYRVISADSHPVSGGFVFSVGRGGAPAESLDELIDAGRPGPATEVGFGIVRGLSYLALALGLGGIASRGGLATGAARRGGGDDEWRGRATLSPPPAPARLRGGRPRLVASALGIVFQGAVATGTSFWSPLDPTVIGDVLGTASAPSGG